MDEQPGRKPDEERPEKEGVRIIGADEAAEALERGDVAQRRSGDTPRYGDRPPPPPEGPRPALRFPLGSSTDPTDLGRPPLAGTEEPAPAEDTGWAEPEPQPEVSIEPEPAAPAAPASPAADQPLQLGGDDVSLPHWTEPATGEVPKVLAAGREDDDDLEAWSSFATSGPRWRDQPGDWDSVDYDDMEGLADDVPRIGALDERDRPRPEEIFSFEEIDEPGFEPQFEAGYEEYEDPTAVEPIPAAEPSPRRIRTAPPREPLGNGHEPPHTAGRNVPVAIGTGLALAIAALILARIGPGALMFIVTPVLVLASAEFFNGTRRAGLQPATLLGVAATTSMVLAAFWRGEAAYPVVLFLTMAFALLWHLFGATEERPVMAIGVTLLGVVYVGVLGSFAALMLTAHDGVGLFLSAVIATVAYDVGGFAIGRNAGHTPLSAASPNKTREGLIGGMVVAVLLTVIVVGVLPGIAPFDSVGSALKLGIVAAVAAPLGDLCESLLKRDLGLKDMGSVLPGHGGFLDRFDALLFVLPSAYYLARVLNLI